MTLSKPELEAIVTAAVEGQAVSARRRLRIEIQRMLNGLADFEFQTKRATPLAKLCTAGADYGWRELQRTATPDLWAFVSSKAKASLRRDLRHRLERITRPCFDLEWKSFGLAMSSIGIQAALPDSKVTARMFLGDKPCRRLFSLFRKFPVLASLWGQVISQWRHYVMEVLLRFTRDRHALSRTFFSGRPIARIVDLRCDLSDWHNSGRTVARIQCEAGFMIYKPRSGVGEWEWFSLLESMNKQSFRPKLRAARVLRRKEYYWMEYVEPTSCESRAAARRFYERIGGLIAAAHLLKLVDCHRDNLIACGEHPVLVDVDALWHVSALTKTQAVSTVLCPHWLFSECRQTQLTIQEQRPWLWNDRESCPEAGRQRAKGRELPAGDYPGLHQSMVLHPGHRQPVPRVRAKATTDPFRREALDLLGDRKVCRHPRGFHPTRRSPIRPRTRRAYTASMYAGYRYSGGD